MSLLPSKFQEPAYAPLGPPLPRPISRIENEAGTAPADRLYSIAHFAEVPHEIDDRTGKPWVPGPSRMMAGANDGLDAMLTYAAQMGWAKDVSDFELRAPVGRPSGDMTAVAVADEQELHKFLYGGFELRPQGFVPVPTPPSPRQQMRALLGGPPLLTAATDAEARDYTQRLKAGKVTVQEAEVMERRMKLRKRMREAQRGYVPYY